MWEPDNIDELDWVPVPNSPYVTKYFFHDSGYIIIFSNLTSIYEEKLTDSDVEARFNVMNSFVKMKPRVIIDNLKKSLENCLMDKSNFSLKLDGNRTTITLTFSVGSVLCNYDVQMNLMPADKVMQYIIGPTVLGALLSQRKVLELQKKIVSLGNNKSSSPAKIVSTQNVIEPDWLKGKNVPTKLICDSFLEIQNHFKDLSAENYDTYSASKKIKTEIASKIPHASPPKKFKLLENKNECRVNFVDEDDEYKLVKKEEVNSNESLDPPRTSSRKKKNFKF